METSDAVARPLKTIAVQFTPTPSRETSIHPIFRFPPTAPPLSSLHSKRVSDIVTMIEQDGKLEGKDESEIHFVIDMGWWKKWIKFDDTSAGSPFSEEIDNWHLISDRIMSEEDKSLYDYETCRYYLDPNITLNNEFLCVSENVWTALRSWYGGGPPLPRRIKCKTGFNRKDLYPASPMSMQSALRLNAAVPPISIKVDSCFCCQRPANDRCNGCSSVYYCSRECQVSHWKYHKTWCKLAAENKSLDPVQFKSVVPTGRKGKTGLANLGNSCYMNSGLQCLSHVSTLTNFLLSDRYLSEVNVENIDGSGGQLIREYSNLLRDLWFGSHKYISPVSFKRVFGKINPDYAGSSQHDVYEAFELLIDKIHEDLNKIVNKPYMEMPEGDGTNDDEISRLAWERHGRRHDSVVKDILGGQLRSQLVCPSCGKVSVSFDPFTSLQLAVPLKSEAIVRVVYVHPVNSMDDGGRQPILLAIEIDLNKPCIALKTEIVKNLKMKTSSTVDIENIELFEIGSDRLPISLVRNGNLVSEVSAGVLFAYFKDPEHDMNSLIFMRKIVAPAKNSGSDSQIRIQQSIGFPIFMSFRSDWSVAKIRLHIWLQVYRKLKLSQLLLYKGLEMLIVLHDCFQVRRFAPCNIDLSHIDDERTRAVRSFGIQKSLSERLPVRLVDRYGHGIERTDNVVYNFAPKPNAEFEKVVPMGHQLENDGGLAALFRSAGLSENDLLKIGSLLPMDAVKVADFLKRPRPNDVVFFSVDWSGAWSNLLDENKLNSLSEPSSSVTRDIADVFLKSNRVRTESEIPIGLDDCFQEFSKEEVLDESESWFCSSCKQHRQAKKTVNLWRLPEVLILGLKRYKQGPATVDMWGGATNRRKIDNFIDFPLDGLNVRNYLSDGSPLLRADSSADESTYDLFAVCNHYGRMGFGHYTALARHWVGEGMSPDWFSFDDDIVSRCTSVSDVKSNAAYVLFYRKRAKK